MGILFCVQVSGVQAQAVADTNSGLTSPPPSANVASTPAESVAGATLKLDTDDGLPQCRPGETISATLRATRLRDHAGQSLLCQFQLRRVDSDTVVWQQSSDLRLAAEGGGELTLPIAVPAEEGVYQLSGQLKAGPDRLWARLRGKERVVAVAKTPVVVLDRFGSSEPNAKLPAPIVRWQSVGQINATDQEGWWITQWLPGQSGTRILRRINLSLGEAEPETHDGKDLLVIPPGESVERVLPTGVDVDQPHRVTLRYPTGSIGHVRVEMLDPTSKAPVAESWVLRPDTETFQVNPGGGSEAVWQEAAVVVFPGRTPLIRLTNLDSTRPSRLQSIQVDTAATTAGDDATSSQDNPPLRSVLFQLDDDHWWRQISKDVSLASRYRDDAATLSLQRLSAGLDRLIFYLATHGYTGAALPLSGQNAARPFAKIEQQLIYERFARAGMEVQDRRATELKPDSQIVEYQVVHREKMSRYLTAQSDWTAKLERQSPPPGPKQVVRLRFMEHLGPQSSEMAIAAIVEAIAALNPGTIIVQSADSGWISDEALSSTLRSVAVLPLHPIQWIASSDPIQQTVRLRVIPDGSACWLVVCNLAPWDNDVSIGAAGPLRLSAVHALGSELRMDVETSSSEAAAPNVGDKEGSADPSVSSIPDSLAIDEMGLSISASEAGMQSDGGSRYQLRLPAHQFAMLRCDADQANLIRSMAWTAIPSGGQPSVDQLKAHVNLIVQRLGMLEHAATLSVLSNPGFEKDGDGGVRGWMHTQHPADSVQIDASESFDGSQSVLLDNPSDGVIRTWLVSETISAPKSGRLAVSLACRSAAKPTEQSHR
ncbi:MAG: hypothetical protein AAGA03_13760, partial [Planctomycetota bacterium]